VNIDEIHILYVVILFHVIFSLQHPCVGTLTMMYWLWVSFHHLQITISLHANIDFHYLVVQRLNNVFLFSLYGN
jgi:hypothetical protein